MFKKRKILIVTLLCSFLLSACQEVNGEYSFVSLPAEDSVQESTEAEESGLPNVSEPNEVSEVSAEESAPQVSEEESNEASIAENEVSMDGVEIVDIGFTEKGYKIQQVNGVYYINGILIANKTYGLPQNYPLTPGLTPETYNAYAAMRKAAQADDLNIYSVSDYRSYIDQKIIYNNYCNRDGQEKADTYSARPGHSEHQSGMAIDLNHAGSDFDGTPEAIWIAEHCAEYGFIIRYPKDKSHITGYKYEPWHVRYVGVELAQALYLGDGEFTTIEEFFGISSEYGGSIYASGPNEASN